ncbi:MAG: ATP-binding protein [Firmicutes bacterium]|nr:ATP-binding protein [Bacillota bacterium]
MTEIKQRDNLIQAVNKAAALLLATNESGGIERFIVKGMGLIGESLGADRIHIWRGREEDGYPQYSREYSWFSEDSRAQKPFPKIITSMGRTDWVERLLCGKCIIGSVSEMPINEQQFLGELGIKSILIFPIFLNGRLSGLLSIDTCTKERGFNEEEIAILRSVSLMMASAISKNVLLSKLREANERASLMLDASPLCTQIINRSFEIIDCNEVAVRLYGFKDKKEYIEKFFGICTPEFQPDGTKSSVKSKAMFAKAFETGYCVFEWMHKLPNQNDAPLPTEITLVRANYNNIDVIIVYSRDLRERKRAIQKAESAQTTMSAMFEANPNPNILFGTDFNVIDCNRAALDFLGFKDKAEMQKDFATTITKALPALQPDGRPSVPISERIKEALRLDFCKFQTAMNIGGKLRYLDVEFKKIPYDGNIAVVLYVYDMTEIHEKELELARINDVNKLQLLSLSLVVKATKIALWDLEVVAEDSVNPRNKAIWTDEFRQLIGYSNETDFPNELSSWINRLHPEDKQRTLNAFENHMTDRTGKTPFDVEYRLLKKNNEYSYYRATGETMRDENGKAIRVAGALMDITQAKNALIEMNKARDAAEVASRTKSAFLANMSHEIRTPMNSIINFAELARYGDIPKKTREYLGRIDDSAKWLLNIINDILDISKIESGKVVLESVPFDLPDVFSYCRSLVAQKATEKGISLYCYAEPLAGKKMLGDPVKLKQIFANLLSNAVKFTSAGTVKMLASVQDVKDNIATIRFEVKDTGIGMTSEQIAKVCEPFVQADSSITRKFGGTGLGLSITKSVIEIMGGNLEISSSLGVGSTFSFEVKFDLIDTANTADKAQAEEVKIPYFNGEVLVCEDNSLNRQVVREYLSKAGVKCVMAHNGKEGVDVISKRLRNAEKPFDLILMDIHMPVMDGLDASSKIVSFGVKTPIVALTANIMPDDLEICRDHGMIDYLGKPYTSRELWNCLSKYLSASDTQGISKEVQAVRDDELKKRLIINFAKSNDCTFAEIMRSISCGDLKSAHRIAHTLKSNSATIGELKLKEIASEVESALEKGTNTLTKKQTDALEAELNAVLKKLKPILQEYDASLHGKTATKTISGKPAIAILEKIEPLIAGNNVECLNFVAEVKTISGAEEIAHHMEEYDFALALKELRELKKNLNS